MKTNSDNVKKRKGNIAKLKETNTGEDFVLLAYLRYVL